MNDSQPRKTRRHITLYLCLSITALLWTGTAKAQSLNSVYSDEYNSDGFCNQNIRSWTWTYTDASGTTHPFADASEQIFQSGDCKGTIYVDSDEWSEDHLYYLQAHAMNGSVTMASGYVNPKYLIMGVTYAPPGGNTQSFVSYTGTNFVGNTSVLTQSFNQNYTKSVSVESGLCLSTIAGDVMPGERGGLCVTGSQSDSWTQASNSSNSITLSKQTSTAFKTPGVPTIYSPYAVAGQPIDGHDYDIVWVWLNPVVTFVVPSGNTSTSGTITWTGYGYDYNDPLHEVDVWPIYVGYLNGHFPKPNGSPCYAIDSTCDGQDAGALSRNWVTTQTFASGQGPGFTMADLSNILAADPFAQNPGYVVALQTGTSPLTTTDGRFTQAGVNGVAPQTIPYKQAPLGSTVGENEMYQNTYVSTSSVGKGGSFTYQVGFGLEEKFGYSFFGIGVVYDFKENWSFTWMNTWQDTVTNTTTQTQTLSITGPPCPSSVAPCNPEYTEPHEFAAYEDNLYGTFMFWPNPYFSLGSVTPATQMVQAGGRASYTIPTAADAGYTGSLASFSVAGLPSGGAAAFSQSSGAPGFTTTLTVSTTSATPAGTYPLAVSATDGSLTYFTYATLVVSASPTFSVATSPTSRTIGINSSATYTITTTVANGFNSVVTLNVTGLPSNSSASFNPETITGAGTSTLTITTTANTLPGTYPLTITGTGGGLTETTPATLVVVGANFSLSTSPEIQAINAGSSTTYTINVSAMNGFNGTVVFSLPGLPSGTSATFNPTSITGSGTSTLTITTTTSVPAGDYSLSVTGTSGTLTQTAPIDLEVNN